MLRTIEGLALAFVAIVCVAPAPSQTVTTTGGTANTIPVFTGGTTLGDSIITVVDPRVGFDQPNPTALLNLTRSIYISPAPDSANYHGDAPLHIYGAGTTGHLTELDGDWWNGKTINIMSSTDSTGASFYWEWGLYDNHWSLGPGAYAQLGPPLAISATGGLGIGTNTPQAALELALPNGSILLSSPHATLTFPDPSVQTTAWNGTTPGGDYAELMQVVGQKTTYEPGDVVELSLTREGHLEKASGQYSRLVAGIMSTKPGLTGKRASSETTDDEEIPVALSGIVPVKVSAENGAIMPGDLLVASSFPGYAMKGTDAERLKGAIVGKALGTLTTGKGLIEALVLMR